MQWTLFLPELYTLAFGVFFLCLAMRKRADAGATQAIAFLLAAGGVVLAVASVKSQGMLFQEAYRVDLFSQVFKVLLAAGLFLVTWLCRELKGIEERLHPEFYAILAICTLALMMLVSSDHLLPVYLSLELSSYSLYVLVPLRRDRGMGMEAGIKYFLIGVVTSAVMLFGMALLYGATQATYLPELARVLPGLMDRPMVMIGLLLTLSGFFFKLAVFPFHFWAPDVYEGSANQVTAFIATASKVAAVAILVRMVSLVGGQSSFLTHILVTLSVVSMTLGNLVAIVQKDLKRLLAYSSIAHAGYILIGILCMSRDGFTGTLFYALAYMVMQFTFFLVVVKVASGGDNLRIDQLAGLHHRSPLLALALMVSAFSLAGIPPTMGFTGKLVIFLAAIEQGHLALVFIAMFNVVISLYYYLMIIRAAYLLEGDEALPPLQLSLATKLLTWGMIALLVTAGIYPAPFLDIARSAAGWLM